MKFMDAVTALQSGGTVRRAGWRFYLVVETQEDGNGVEHDVIVEERAHNYGGLSTYPYGHFKDSLLADFLADDWELVKLPAKVTT